MVSPWFLFYVWKSESIKFKSLVSQKARVHEVRVFGSRARGDASEESDLDVLVVVNCLDHSIEKYISECAWEVGFSEDIVIITYRDKSRCFKEYPNP